MDRSNNGHGSRRTLPGRLIVGFAATLILASNPLATSAKDSKSPAGQFKSLKVDTHRIPKKVPHFKPKTKMDGSLSVEPGGSAFGDRHIPPTALLSNYLCMWSRDPGGDQPHFMMGGTCPAPRGAHIGDWCQCREHGDQHRGYVDGRVIGGNANGKPRPPR